MNNTNPDQPGANSDAARYLMQLEQTNRDLNQRVADCHVRLGQVQTTLTEAQRTLAGNRQFEAERSRLLVRERELNELKSNFVTLASHEFRTPMMTILSSASLIGRYHTDADSDKRERHVQRIKSAIDSLTGILNAFLSISQMEQNAVVSHPGPLNLAECCRAVIADVRAAAKPRQQFQYAHRGDAAIVVDGEMLKPILLNLLTNASQYSAEETDVRLTTTVRNGQVRIVVTDQGIGIPDADKDKLFVNFFRARNAIHIQGTGLGLYLVKRYVDLLGGTIHVASQLGQGTTFTVQFPLTNPSA